MDTANLQAFLAVADTGSFSRAAEQLHLTQPAVSKRIAMLEQQLDARLFDRIGRHVSLTEAGLALQPRAQQVLSLMNDTRRALSNLSSEVSGRLSIATSHHIGLHRLPPVLREFTRRHPQVSFDIQFLDSEVAYDKVLHGEIELAVITLAPEVAPPVMSELIWDDPLDFVVLRALFGGYWHFKIAMDSIGVKRFEFRDTRMFKPILPELETIKAEEEKQHIAIEDAKAGRLNYLQIRDAVPAALKKAFF